MERLKKIEITKLNGVGPKRLGLYNKLEITNVYDLLRFYPRAYIDFTSNVLICDSIPGEINTIKAFVGKKLPVNHIRRGMTLYKVIVTDGMSNMTITFFNNNYSYEQLEINKEYCFYGKVSDARGKYEMSSPSFVLYTDDIHMQPVYHLTGDLTSKMVITNITEALKLASDELTEPIPSEILKEQELCGLNYALNAIHFPKNSFELEIARKRLIFEELFTLQTGMFLLKNRNRKKTSVVIDNFDLKNFYNKLSFKLTNAQENAINDCIGDMKGTIPMNRLVQGDVGSGKTAVASAICYICANNGYQSAFMAPTEILASQHYRSISALLDGTEFNIALLTGSLKKSEKDEIKKGIADGKYHIVIGTHALIQSDVEFKSLGFVITDEQHRFGVKQRSVLSEKGNNPHVMIMSATPIPRTLALIIYGDLDVSVIGEMPKGRQPVNTMAVSPDKRSKVFAFIEKLLKEGRQAYIVCPAIEENENENNNKNNINSVLEYRDKIIADNLKDFEIAVLHGKLKPGEKDRIMNDFKENKINVLISTTVIEVGVDVPNASVMVIENAECFGLSQMHQLRGRVGRGKWKSYCILISGLESEENMKRIKTMCDISDGFKISEEDLKQRGPGDFFGKRQHGLPKLKIADMAKNMDVLKQTAKLAREILNDDPELNKYPGLSFLISDLFEQNGDYGYN